MKLLVVNGPNLNMLGVREPHLYGRETYQDLVAFVEQVGAEEGIQVECFQSNHEGALVERIQQALGDAEGIIINGAAYSHTSIALLDALKAVALPAVEVHLTDIRQREPFRQLSYPAMACMGTYTGLGFEGYRKAICHLKAHLMGEEANETL